MGIRQLYEFKTSFRFLHPLTSSHRGENPVACTGAVSRGIGSMIILNNCLCGEPGQHLQAYQSARIRRKFCNVWKTALTLQPAGGITAALPPEWVEPASYEDADSSGKAHICEITSSKRRNAGAGLLFIIHPSLSFLSAIPAPQRLKIPRQPPA